MFTYPIMPPPGFTSTLAEGLVSWWELDETSGNRVDSHLSSYSCTPTGTTSYGTGQTGNALSLVKTGYVGRANITALDFSGDFSAAIWVKPTTYIAGGAIMGQFVHNTSGWGMWAFNGSVNCEIGGGYISITGFVTGAWQLLIMQYDATAGHVYTYKNNAANSNGVRTRTQNGTAPFNIGSYNNGSDIEFDGLMEGAVMWNKMLTSDERTELYNGGSGITYGDL